MKDSTFKKVSRYTGPEESPGYLLWRVSTQWRRSIEAVLKPHDLTHPQFVVLAALAWLTKEGEKVSQTAIAQQTGLDPNTTSQIIRGLEKKHLLQRSHTIDERTKSPSVTPLGTQTLKNALPAVEEADERFFSQLSASELKNLIRSFQQLIPDS